MRSHRLVSCYCSNVDARIMLYTLAALRALALPDMAAAL
jgi:hypothetical protein